MFVFKNNCKMGETNTPPVSPRDPGPNDSDDEVTTTQNEDEEDFEVIEVYEEDIEEGAEAEELTEGDYGVEGEDGQDEEEMEEADVPDDSIITFKNHAGKFQYLKVLKPVLITFFFLRFCILLFN